MAMQTSKSLAICNCDQAQSLIEAIMAEVEAGGFGEQACFAIRLALDEAITNAIRHGNGNDPSKKVDISYRVNGEDFRISIEDEGPGFDPDELPDPTDDQFIERPCGRGVMLMQAYMSHVEFHGRGNRVTLVKRKNCTLPSL